MIRLFADMFTAIRVLATQDVRRPDPRTGAGTHPAEADSFASVDGLGGTTYDTSELLTTAASFVRAYRDSITSHGPGPYIEQLDLFVGELRDRAASLAAVGD